jgi:hypothetical protein
MDDEYYDSDGHDNGLLFADVEEEAHFFGTVSDFLDLMDVYTVEVVMGALKQMSEDEGLTLTSIN